VAYQTVKAQKSLKLRILPWISLATVILLWQFCVSPAGVNDWRIPGVLLARPYDVLLLAFEKMTDVNPDGATLQVHAWVSLQESLAAFILSLLIGIPLGLLMGWFGVVRGLFRPIFEMWRPIPPVAWIPLTIFWFGIGMEGKIFIILLGGMTPCIINSYMGVRMTNPVHIQMARTFGASDWKIFTSICVPSALPMVFGALQIALGNCWTTLVAAELLASDQGLGYLITAGRSLGRTDIVVLGMVSLGITGVIISQLIYRIEARLLAGIRR
jgi:ABC-type nitrate/sulfonate/bicarbonate transport system permease component